MNAAEKKNNLRKWGKLLDWLTNVYKTRDAGSDDSEDLKPYSRVMYVTQMIFVTLEQMVISFLYIYIYILIQVLWKR